MQQETKPSAEATEQTRPPGSMSDLLTAKAFAEQLVVEVDRELAGFGSDRRQRCAEQLMAALEALDAA